MTHSIKVCDVKGGRIKTTCPRCLKTRFIEVEPGMRQRIVRCGCGKAASYQLNHRRVFRGSASTRAWAVLGDSTETWIRVCDASELGIGFHIDGVHARSLQLGQELSIRYHLDGAPARRHIKIRNINGTRVGAEYA